MRRFISAALALAMCGAAGGCATARPTSSSASLSPMAITELKTVVGKWEGVGQGPWAGSILGGHTGDWVEFTIREDGTYEARSYREFGVLRSAGTLKLGENALHWESARSRGVVYLLADQSGKRFLRLKGELASGAGVLTAELMPADKR